MRIVSYTNNSMKRLFQLRRLEAIAFISGFALMAFELVAARILAPYIGSSTYVWTSVIGVIIASLSIGYYVGGRIADTHQRLSDIAWLCLVAAIAVAMTAVFYHPVLSWASTNIADSRLQGVVASLLLFAPASFLIGIKAPYLAKLKVTSLDHTGRSVASLSALNSVGGIAGVFVAGFILFGYLGSKETLAVIVVLLIISSWLVASTHRTTIRIAVSLAVLAIVLLPAKTPGVIDIDTPTAHYQVREGYIESGRAVRALTSGPRSAQSGVYVDGGKELAFWYTRELAALVDATRARERILILGGGTFTLPEYLAKRHPASTIDVVEIDPALTNIAQTYFHYQPPANVNPIFNDARGYINAAKQAYDIILVDVYSDINVPFSLMTKEYGTSVAKLLKPQGVLAANVIAATTGPCRPLLDAIDAAYRTALPYAAYATFQPATAKDRRANMIVAYSRHAATPQGYETLVSTDGTPYTDNFMPAERLQHTCQEKSH